MCPYPVIDSIKVGVEALVIPPTAMWDLSADVSTVWCTEALLIVVPTERVLNRTTEAWHMETVLMLLIFHTARNYVSNTVACVCFGISSPMKVCTVCHLTLTWSSGRGHACACWSSLPGQSAGCSLPGHSDHVCGHCLTRTLSAAHQIHPCSPSSCGQSSLSHQIASESQSSRHLGESVKFIPCLMGYHLFSWWL